MRRTELVDSLKRNREREREKDRDVSACVCCCVLYMCVCCLLDINNYNLQCKIAANKATKLQVLKLNILLISRVGGKNIKGGEVEGDNRFGRK